MATKDDVILFLNGVLDAAEAMLQYLPDPDPTGPDRHSGHAMAAYHLRNAVKKARGLPLDTFIRPAQTKLPGGKTVERDWKPSEIYQLYCRGFRDGAGTKPMRKDHMGLGPYDRGYAEGAQAARDACALEAKRLRYEPTILRDGEEE